MPSGSGTPVLPEAGQKLVRISRSRKWRAETREKLSRELKIKKLEVRLLKEQIESGNAAMVCAFCGYHDWTPI